MAERRRHLHRGLRAVVRHRENEVLDQDLPRETTSAEDMTSTRPFRRRPPSAPSTRAGPPPSWSRGHTCSLKWWTFVGVLAGVWFVFAAAGAGLYYYWYQSADKTWPVFVVCSPTSSSRRSVPLVASTAQRKPLVSALAIALMSAPHGGALAAAAAFYGAYVIRLDRPARRHCVAH